MKQTRMQSKLIFHKQETPYSCVPACLRMVLSAFEVDMSEDELRHLCDCTPFGTEALKAVDAVRNLGFSRTTKCTLTINDVFNRNWVKQHLTNPNVNITPLSFRQAIFASFACFTLVMGVRYVGLLQAWELGAFDRVMRSKHIWLVISSVQF
jgi:Peptidase C39 family